MLFTLLASGGAELRLLGGPVLAGRSWCAFVQVRLSTFLSDLHLPEGVYVCTISKLDQSVSQVDRLKAHRAGY